eukprot:scaffold575_cov242-Pinguiococcus_pyrenoidosus.AAC.9
MTNDKWRDEFTSSRVHEFTGEMELRSGAEWCGRGDCVAGVAHDVVPQGFEAAELHRLSDARDAGG